MKKWLGQFDWAAIFGSALFLVIVMWIFAANDGKETYLGPLAFVLGLLPPEGWTALFTCLLFVSTALLWQVTKASAEAAKAAAEALPKVERGYVFREGAVDYFVAYSPVHSYASFRFKNLGKTPVALTDIYRFFGYMPREKDPEKLIKLQMPIDPVIPLGAGEIAEEPFQANCQITVDEYNAAHSGEGTWILIVCLGYEDIFGERHETWFCERFRGEAGFLPYRSDSLNKRT